MNNTNSTSKIYITDEDIQNIENKNNQYNIFINLLPQNYKDIYNNEQIKIIIMYFSQLNDIEKKSCKIAKSHLQSSFDIIKSNGFNNWKTKNF